MNLRDIVNAATKDGWWKPVTETCDCGGDWPCHHGEYAYALRLTNSDELVYDDAEWHGSVGDAEFIATFDPQLVGRLLDVVDRARTCVAAHDEANDEMDWTPVAVDRLLRDALAALDEVSA